MRTVSSEWKECIIQYNKVMENSMEKKVKETYVVPGDTFTLAEARIISEMNAYNIGAFDVMNINPAPYKEIFFMNDGEKILGNQHDDLMQAMNKGDREKFVSVYERPLDEQMNNTDTRWYKAKLAFITIDEKTEKEKRTNVYYLVQATSFNNARENVTTVMKGSMFDYVIVKIEETKIMDVFEFIE